MKISVKRVKSHPLGRLPPYLPTWRRTALAPGRLARRLERAFSRSAAAKRQQVAPTSVRANYAGVFLLHQACVPHWRDLKLAAEKAGVHWGAWYLRNVFLPFTTFYFLKTHPKNIGRGHNLLLQNGSCLIMDVLSLTLGPPLTVCSMISDLLSFQSPFLPFVLFFCFCWLPVIVLLHMKTAAGVPVRLC